MLAIEPLQFLPEEERARVAAHLTPVTLNAHRMLYETGRPIEHIYFLRSGLVSLCAGGENGRAVETGTIGPGGLVGSNVLLGWTRANCRAVVAITSDAMRAPTIAFVSACEACPVLAAFVKQQIAALLLQAQQNALCHALHLIEARLSRWLLQASNALGTDELDLTQEFFARLLGVQRTSVSMMAQRLQQAGCITTVRGKVRIIDSVELEKAACGCYAHRRQHTVSRPSVDGAPIAPQ